MKTKYDSHLVINRTWSNIYERIALDGESFYEGLYYSKYGIVKCISEPKRNTSDLRFVYQGILYTRSFEKAHSITELTIAARKFVNETIDKIKEVKR